MTTYQDIRLGRGLVWAGIAVGFAVAIVTAIVNLVSGDGTPFTALAFLALLAIPPTMAVISLDRRPSLLTAAAMAAVVQGFITLTSFGLIEFIPAILWAWAGQRRPRPALEPGWATWARPLIAAASILPLVVMFMHVDPRCTTTAADGTVISTTIDEKAATGWRLELGSSGSSATGSDGITRSCTSDTVQGWEALVSIALSALILAGVSRWPTAVQIHRELGEEGVSVPSAANAANGRRV